MTAASNHGVRRRAVLGLVALVSVSALFAAKGCLSLERDPHELAVGAEAPRAVALLDVHGKPFSLVSAAAQRRVLVFYRGAF